MKKLFLLTAALFLLLAAPAFASTPTLKLQQKLVELGYLPDGAADGNYGEATTFAIEAFQKQEGLARDGVAGAQTKARLATAEAPAPRLRHASAGRRVEISISRQLLYLISNNQVLRTIAVSTAGPGHYTPTGHYGIYRKERKK